MVTQAEAQAELARRRAQRSQQPQQPSAPQANASGVTAEQARAELARRRAAPSERREPPNVAVDASRSFLTGLQRGVAGLIGLPRDVSDLWEGAVDAGADAVRGFLIERGYDPASTISPESRRRLEESQAQSPARIAAERAQPGGARRFDYPSGAEVNDRVQDVLGQQHEPETVAGEYARTLGEFAPAALAPGGLVTRATRVAVPAVASETAGQATEGTPLETPARLIAGLGAGVATEVSIAANASRAAARAAQPNARNLEQEFGPLTAAERSGNPRARLEEDDMRRGIGSERAQRTMQAFDDRRAPEIQQNVMNIATRGQEPVSEDLGAAGTVVSDALRTRMDNMRAQQGQLYKEAFDAAESELVSANEAATDLLTAVDDAIARDFLDAGPSRNIIARLQADISQGRANYGTVERARQALNRQLGTAMKAQDDAGAYAIMRVIDELDAFVEPRLSADARRAITEARGFSREMMNTLGQRQRTDLATGHVGRSDPGGRAIERVLNTDLTGEQVVDAILGSSTRPSQQTLGAVRRIREINDEAISYTNRNAASGVRVPGRTRVGGQTRGARGFAADTPEARYGIELPNPELQGIREALFHRILRPMTTRNDGGAIPAQTVVTNLRRALDGAGKEITQVIFTENEIASMRRALAYMERLIPPQGAAVSGTTPAFARMVTGTFDKLVGLIPGIGPALREVIENANSTGAARRAIEPPRAQAARQARVDQPVRSAPVVTGAASVASASQERR